MAELSKTMRACLAEIAEYSQRDGYPEYWKPATREKLVKLGLVRRVASQFISIRDRYFITNEGRAKLTPAKPPST